MSIMDFLAVMSFGLTCFSIGYTLGKVGELITNARRFKENDFSLTSAQILFLVTGFFVFAIQRL